MLLDRFNKGKIDFPNPFTFSNALFSVSIRLCEPLCLGGDLLLCWDISSLCYQIFESFEEGLIKDFKWEKG